MPINLDTVTNIGSQILGINLGNPLQAALKNNPFAAPTHRFPLDLGSVSAGEEPYIIFAVYDSVYKGNPQCKCTIALNMPGVLKAQYSAGYRDIDVDVLESLNSVSKATISAIKNSGSAQGEAAMDQLYLDIFRAVTDYGMIKFNPLTMVKPKAKAEQLTGYIVNPHSFQLFENMRFRNFRFEFNMMARNAQESDQIALIIKTFKYYMHPGFPDDGGTSRNFLAPENFIIRAMSPAPESNYLFKISSCVLKDMEVDYGAQGQPVFFKNTGAPVNVNMTLNFTELEVLTKERIREGF